MRGRGLALLLLALGAVTSGQDGVKTVRFQAKLNVGFGSESSHVGDAVVAAVISPERFLGGRLDGTVEEAGTAPTGHVRFTFQRLLFRGRRWTVASKTTYVVNSIGHPLLDEQERSLRVANGVVWSTSPVFTVDEGAEIKMDVQVFR